MFGPTPPLASRNPHRSDTLGESSNAATAWNHTRAYRRSYFASYSVDLLADCPDMPKYAHMLEIVARNPVAAARCLILSLRLWCEHIMGTGPFDSPALAEL